MENVLFLVQTILAVVLIIAVILQLRGQGFTGTFNDSTTIHRTRRGVEKTLFQFTIGLAIAFMAVAVLTVVYVS
ncbi:MAG: preprotein translocase subunit SecG [Thermomicrobiales bacterium]